LRGNLRELLVDEGQHVWTRRPAGVGDLENLRDFAEAESEALGISDEAEALGRVAPVQAITGAGARRRAQEPDVLVVAERLVTIAGSAREFAYTHCVAIRLARARWHRYDPQSVLTRGPLEPHWHAGQPQHSRATGRLRLITRNSGASMICLFASFIWPPFKSTSKL
jgi:hypothetical protein